MNGSSEEFGGKKMTAPFFYKEKNMIRKCYFKKKLPDFHILIRQNTVN